MGLLNALLDLFVEFLKIGFLMFGGAYSGVALMHKELVELKGWFTNEEFIDVVGIS
ncbi:MAG: chromate transporter, partial [Zestosphaera sp.]